MPFTVPPVRRSPCDFLHRHRLARDHRLIHGTLALKDDAVDGHLLPGADAEPVARLDVRQRDIFFRAVIPEPPGGLRGQAQERLDRTTGLAPGAELEHLAEEDEGRDHRRRLEVDRRLAAVAPEGVREDVRKERRDHTVAVGRADADGDEGEHVEAAVDEGGPAALEERPAAPEDHWGGQSELDPGETDARRGHATPAPPGSSPPWP